MRLFGMVLMRETTLTAIKTQVELHAIEAAEKDFIKLDSHPRISFAALMDAMDSLRKRGREPKRLYISPELYAKLLKEPSFREMSYYGNMIPMPVILTISNAEIFQDSRVEGWLVADSEFLKEKEPSRKLNKPRKVHKFKDR